MTWTSGAANDQGVTGAGAQKPTPGDLLDELFAAALGARERAWAPYSRFRVGAALATAGGRIVTGCNVENASYGLTICAERVALAKAVSEGERDVRVLALVTDAAEPLFPCGACRQFLAELAPGLVVHAFTTSREHAERTLASLLPESFSASSLEGRRRSDGDERT